MGVMSMLLTAGQTWGDYTVRMRARQRRPRQRGAARVGHARPAEQLERQDARRWRSPSPAAAPTSKAVQTTAALDGDEWVINGEKIFVTTGCRAEGVVVWATIDKCRAAAPASSRS